MKTFEENEQKIMDMEERFGVDFRELFDAVNAPCANVLDKLWKELILSGDPDYGDWEYPGQAYRHLKARYKELEAANDWTMIMTDQDGRPVEETLPEQWRAVDVSVYDPEKGTQRVLAGYYDRGWRHSLTAKAFPDWCIPYAWKEKPDPAPYPEAQR